MALTNKLWNRRIAVRRLVTDKKMQGAALPWPTQVVRAAGPEAHTSAMPLEEPLSVEVNGQRVAVLMRLPGSEKELGAGFCISEGIIASFDAVLTVHHCGRGLPDPIGSSQEQAESRNRVQIRARPEAVHFDAQSDVVRLIRTGCGAVEVTDMVDNLPRLNSNLCVPAEMLLGLNATMRQAQDLYKVSGGVHAAALFDDQGHLIALQEDVGRHNAIDKVIGHCLLRGISLQDRILVATGRASHDMVTKAVRVGIPIITSISAATALAAQIAEDRRATLIGYLRSRRMSVYTHSWRVES
jgi:FdhD protein